jgi:LPXTG-site transpeptidase (sortase) family protein
MPISKNTSSKKDILKVLGILLILGGFLLLYLIYFPVLKEEVSYRFVSVKNSSQEKKEMIPVDEDFALVIPKIKINAKVFPGVDASNPKEYLPLLAKGVAQAKGSVEPGEEGNLFIFAHSTDTSLNASRYNAVFYLLNKMEKDDEVIVYYQQEKYLYQVLEKKIIRPEELNDYLKTLKGKTLTLQTCYPPGTTLKRLLVIAKETEE